MKFVNPKIVGAFCLFLFLLGGLTPVFSQEYKPDQALIAKYRAERERLAAEFTGWSKSVRSEKPEQRIQLGHSSSVESVAFSPDGRYVISGSGDNTLKLWEVSTGLEIRTYVGHSSDVSSVAFSPYGRYALSGSWDETLKLWELTTGKEIKTFNGHYADSVTFSPDGKYALSGSRENTLKLWEVSTGEEIRTFSGHKDVVTSVAFSPDGRYTLSGSWDKTLKLWDVVNGKELRTFSGHSGYVNSIAFAPDGQQVISGSHDDTLKLWDVTTGKQIRKFTGHLNEVTAVSFSPDGRYALSGSWDRTLKLWDIATGKELRTFSGHSGFVLSVDFSPDGRYALSGSSDGTLKLWEVSTGNEIQTFSGYSNNITTVDFSPYGGFVLSGSSDNTLRLWEISTGLKLHTYTGHTGSISSVAFSSDGRFIYSGSRDNTIRLWDKSTGKEIRTISVYPPNYIEAVAFSKDSRNIIFSDHFNNKLYLIDMDTGEEIRTFTGHPRNYVFAVAFSPGGKYILSGAQDYTLKLWETATGREIRTFIGHSFNVLSVAFSPDGRSVLSGSGDKTLRLWEVSTGKEIRNFSGHSDFIGTVAFSPDGRHALSGSRDKTLKLWEVSTGKEIRTFTGHSNWVESVAFSPDGRFALSGSRDSTMKLWNVNTGELIYTAIASPDGQSLVWTPEGYFAGDEELARKAVYIVDGLTTYSIDQFFDQYYRPDIIAAKVAGEDITALVGDNVITKNLQPPPETRIEIERTDGRFRGLKSSDDDGNNYKIVDGKMRVKVTAVDKGGGVNEIRFYHNGARVAGGNRGLKVLDRDAIGDDASHIFTVQLTDGENRLRAVGLSSDRVESSPAVVLINYSAPRLVKPTLWLVAIGINQYKNGRYNLNYAVNDAKSFLQAIRQAGEQLFTRIETNLLTDNEATRTGIMNILTRVKQRSSPEDVFMFFYAGHGIALEYEETERPEFFFIPTDVTQMTDPNQVKRIGLSGPEFEDIVAAIPARKQFLVLDACNSGAINTAFGVRGAGEEIALARLSRSMGSALIAASREDQFAQEFSALGQGALTKALLEGLGGEAAREDGQITVGDLKGYVERALPELTEEYAGRAQYPTGFIFGQDFPVGMMK